MKKLESTWYNMALVLTGIAVVAGAALGYVNSMTAPTIEALKIEQEKAAELEVLNGQEGTAIKITDPKGFGGALTVMVGLANDGTILGYKVLESSETPGLGAKAQDWFQKGQKGDIIGKQAKVDITVGINSGYSVPQTCRKVQEKVKTSIETMTGLEVVDVNVRVSSVALPQNE